ncbi:MAG: AAA family ATPase, partial [Planctomycetales bacterium]|nr:AAA family ATPase [Planctomycetales bacterium]
TRELQLEEKRIIDFAKLGRGRMKPLGSADQIEKGTLSDEQFQAVTGLLESSDQLQIVRGVAGVGKSYMLQHFVPAVEENGRNVAILAPTNKATENLQNDGFEASTIQSFLLDEKAQQNAKHGVIVVDEAGLIGSPTFRALVEVADRQKARIVAIGDDRQHLPIERGHPMKLLEQQAGIEPKQISKIRRQRGTYRDAVEALSRADIEEGFELLQALDFVHEIDDDDRDHALATAYADAREENKNDKLLVIAPTHAERRKITEAIRDELKSRGLIATDAKKTRHFTTLVSKSLSEAQRQDPLNYQVGDVVTFHAKAPGGIQSGDQLTITKVERDKVVAGNQEIPLESAGSFSVFLPEAAEYAVGDFIRLTRGRRQDDSHKKLANGSLHKIKSFHKGVVILDNGEKLESDWRFFDHGFAVTSHVSQGTTVDRAFVAASSLSFPASSPEQMYVSASRAKRRVDIYTDSSEGLLRVISKFRPKQLATDVTPDIAVESAKRRSKLNRIKHVAMKFATKQLDRFYDWLPNKQMQPQLGR